MVGGIAERATINVEGFPPGTEVKDPYTDKISSFPNHASNHRCSQRTFMKSARAKIIAMSI
jgi:hypothetical protein